MACDRSTYPLKANLHCARDAVLETLTLASGVGLERCGFIYIGKLRECLFAVTYILVSTYLLHKV